MILVNGENVTDFKTEKYNPGFRMLEIVENCPFVGRELETRSILTALAAGQNVVLYGQSGFGKTAFAEWAKKAFGAGECIETYSYKKFETIDDFDKAKTNIVILQDYNYFHEEGYGYPYLIHSEIADGCSLRVMFAKISDEDFKGMLLKEERNCEEIKICGDEILLWKQNIDKIKIPDEILESILKLHKISCGEGDGEWYNAMQLVKASAYFAGYKEVDWDNLKILADSVFHNRDVHIPRLKRIESLIGDLVRTIKKETSRKNYGKPENDGREYVIDGMSLTEYEAKNYFRELFSEE